MVTKTFSTIAQAGAEIDKRTKRYMAEHGTEDYADAMLMVLRADPELAAVYSGLSRPQRRPTLRQLQQQLDDVKRTLDDISNQLNRGNHS